MHSNRNIKTLVEVKRLAKIAYSDKPLPQNGKIVYLTPEELEQKFGFIYSESLYGNECELAEYINNPKYEQLLHSQPGLPNFAKVRERLKNPLDSLVICNMGPVGHGLFTTVDLPKGTVLFLYAGEIHDAKNENVDEYDLCWDMDGAQKYSVGAKRIGGLARFMQHLPYNWEQRKAEFKQELLSLITPEILKSNPTLNIDRMVEDNFREIEKQKTELADLKFLDSKTKINIQGNNVRNSYIVIDGIPVTVAWTSDGIKANTQVGFCYGPGYWIKCQPRYFYTNGDLVPLSAYQNHSALNLLALQNPYEIYRKGIEAYSDKQNELALKLLNQALELYGKKQGTELEQANCASALVSVLLDGGMYGKAIELCEKAINLYALCMEKVQGDILQEFKNKYWKCLELSKTKVEKIYTDATVDFTNARYYQAAFKLEYLVSKKIPDFLLAYSHSILASVYRELKKFDIAVSHAKMELSIRTKINCDVKLIQKSQAKLAELEFALAEKNKNSGKQVNL